jgi:hypothetical protein
MDFNNRGNKNKKDRIINIVISFYDEIFDNINPVYTKKILAHIIIILNRRPKSRKIEIFTDLNKFQQLPVKQETKSEILYFPPSASSVSLSRLLSAVNLDISREEKNTFILTIDITKNPNISEKQFTAG